MANNLKITRKSIKDNLIDAKIDIAESGLLGSYDSQSNYFISPKIQEELVHIQKFKKTTFGNSLFCVAHHLAFGELVFEITYDKYVEEGFSVATLYLLENVVKINGYLQNTIKTKVCDYSDLIVDFIEKSYEFYNVEIDEDEAKDKNMASDVFINMYISSKKQYDKALRSILDKKLASLYEKYFNKRMSVLKSLDSEFASQVLEIYNKEHDLIDNIFLQNNKDYKALNSLLDKAIEQVSGLSKELDNGEAEYNARIQKDKDDFEKSINKIYQQAESKAYIMLSKNEKSNMSDILEDENTHEKNILEGKDERPFIVNNGMGVTDNDENELEKNTKQDDLENVIEDKSDYSQTQYNQLESKGERKKRLDALAAENEEEQELEEEDPKKMSKAQSAIYDMLSGKSKAKGKGKTEPISKVEEMAEETDEHETDVIEGGKAVIVSKKKAKRIERTAPEGVVEDKTLEEDVVEETDATKPVKPSKPVKPAKGAEKVADEPDVEKEETSPADSLRRLQELRKKTTMPATKGMDDDSVVVKHKDGKKVVEPTKVNAEDVVIDKKKAATMSKAEQESYRKTVAKQETDKRQSEAYQQLLERQRKEAQERQAKMDEMSRSLERERREKEALELKNKELTQENEELEAREEDVDERGGRSSSSSYDSSTFHGGYGAGSSLGGSIGSTSSSRTQNAVNDLIRQTASVANRFKGTNSNNTIDPKAIHRQFPNQMDNESLGTSASGMDFSKNNTKMKDLDEMQSSR